MRALVADNLEQVRNVEEADAHARAVMAGSRGLVAKYDWGHRDEARAWAQRCLGDILRERVGEHADHAAPAIAEVLGSTPSRLVVMALEDLMGALDQTNIPGTIDQYPNWRRRLPDFIEDLQQNSTFDEVANAFARCGRSI